MGRMNGEDVACPFCGLTFPWDCYCDGMREFMSARPKSERRVPRFEGFESACHGMGAEAQEEVQIVDCTRDPNHDGPCNGWPKAACKVYDPSARAGTDLHIALGELLGNDRLQDFFADAVDTLRKKGLDYGKGTDRLANFRKLSEELGLPMAQVWRVFFSKSMDAITNYCARGQVESEPIRKRLVDAVNYLALLDLIVADSGKEKL